MNQTNKRCLKELDTYWNERLAYLSQIDRLDKDKGRFLDADALYSEFIIDGDPSLGMGGGADILFLEYLNDL
jgi:hypothetical protein